MERKLSIAARNGSQDTIVELCGEGVDPNVADISDNNHTPIHIASLAGNTVTVLALVKCGANMDFGDADGNTPLHLAVKNEHYKVSDILLFSGADPKISNRDGKTAYQLAQKAKHDNFRNSFAENILDWFSDARELTDKEEELHKYSKEGRYIGVAKLCKKGIDVQVKDIENKGNTALHLAAVTNVFNMEPTILALIKCGANVNARNVDGDTPLHSAIVEGSDAAFSVLLLNRAELFLPNKEGKTAYQLALQKGTHLMKRMVSSSSYNWIVNSMLV